jgi:hypothetical protein
MTFEFTNGEPPVLLGANEGANPVEFLLHALAGCVTTTFVLHATARGIAIQELSTQLEGEIDLQGLLGLDDSVPPATSRSASSCTSRPTARTSRSTRCSPTPCSMRRSAIQCAGRYRSRSTAPVRDLASLPVERRHALLGSPGLRREHPGGASSGSFASVASGGPVA